MRGSKNGSDTPQAKSRFREELAVIPENNDPMQLEAILMILREIVKVRQADHRGE